MVWFGSQQRAKTVSRLADGWVTLGQARWESAGNPHWRGQERRSCGRTGSRYHWLVDSLPARPGVATAEVLPNKCGGASGRTPPRVIRVGRRRSATRAVPSVPSAVSLTWTRCHRHARGRVSRASPSSLSAPYGPCFLCSSRQRVLLLPCGGCAKTGPANNCPWRRRPGQSGDRVGARERGGDPRTQPDLSCLRALPTWILREVRVSDRGEGARGVRGMPGQEVVTEGGRQRRCSKPSHCGRTGCFCHGESGALFRSWPVATIASLICEIAT